MRLHVCAAVATWLMVQSAFSEVEQPAGLRTLPPIVLPSLTGQYVFLSDLCYEGDPRPRKPRSTVVLNFMASWCGPCKKELPELLAAWREVTNQNVRLYLISVDKLADRDKLEQVLKDYKVDCDVLLDPYMKAAERLGIDGSIPQTIVVSPTGQIAARLKGAENGTREHFLEAIRQSGLPAQ